MSMLGRHGRVCVLAVALAGGLVLAFGSWPSQPDEPEPQVWTLGERRAYALRAETESEAWRSGDGARLRARVALHGRLVLEVLPPLLPTPGGARLQVTLSHLSYERDGTPDPAIAELLSLPWSVVVSPLGEFGEPEFDPRQGGQERLELRELLHWLQVVWPPVPAAKWSGEERHALGRYAARYALDARGEVTKERVRYVEAAPTLRSLGVLHVVRSRTTARRTPGKPWLERLDLDEEVRAPAEGQAALHVVVRARLEALPAPGQGPPPVLPPVQREAVPARGPAPPVATINGDHASPEAADAAIDALARLGSPDAQAALASLHRDALVPEPQRRRALIALGGAARPTPDTVESLWSTWAEPTGPHNETLFAPAGLALGRVARALREGDTQRYEAALERLLGALRASDDPQRTLVLLKALGNVGDPALVPALTPFLEAEAPVQRVAAAQALAACGGAPAVDALLVRLGAESVDAVRLRVAEALAAFSPFPETAWTRLGERALEERDAATRTALARLLARPLAQPGTADRGQRAALERLEGQETDPELLAWLRETLAR